MQSQLNLVVKWLVIMIAALEIQYHLSEEPAKIHCHAFNGEVSARSQSYVNFEMLRRFASSLKTIDFSAGQSASFGKEEDSVSFVKIEFSSLGHLGRILVVARLATGDYEAHRSTATVRFESDRSCLDRFASELLLAISSREGTATLEGVY